MSQCMFKALDLKKGVSMNIFSRISKKIAPWLGCLLLLVSCNMPGRETSASDSQTWLDQPTTASLLPLAPFTLKAHARGVSRIDFLVNDIQVGSVVTDPSQPIAYAEISWNPSATGSYTIAAQAFSGDGSVLSQIATVCVSDTVTAASASFSGDCANPIPLADVGTPTPSTDPITIVANVNDNPVYYGDCNPHALTVKASLNGDLSALDTVRVRWVYDTETSSSPSGLGDVPFDDNEMQRQADGSYLWSADLNTAAKGWGLTGNPYVIRVYVTAWDSSGQGLGTTGPMWRMPPGSRM